MTTYVSEEGAPNRTNRRQSFIDKDSQFSGTYTTPNDLLVEGRLDGTIDCAGALIVADNADVNAKVTAGSVSVAGQLHGDIGCRGRFEILSTGRVQARVQAVTVVVQDGGKYEGEMRMRPEGSIQLPDDSGPSKRPEPRAARRSTPVEPSEVPSFSVTGGRSNGRSLSSEGSSRAMLDRPEEPGLSTSADS